MPEPEGLIFMFLSAGFVVAAMIAFAFSKKTACAPACGCLLCLLAAPGLFLLVDWGVYWVTRPGEEEIRAALPGEWIGEGRWSTDRLAIAEDMTTVQTIQKENGRSTVVKGRVGSIVNDCAMIGSIDVPADPSASEPSAPLKRDHYESEGPLFRFARGDGSPVLIMRNPEDTGYVFRKRPTSAPSVTNPAEKPPPP